MNNFLEPAFSMDETRAVWIVVLLITGTLALWGIVQAATTGWRWRDRFAWQMAQRMVGWMPALAACVALILGWVIGDVPPEQLEMAQLGFLSHLRIVETIIPLAIGLQAAFLFSPDDEPALEVLIACPRPLSLLLMERLLALLVIQVVIALLGTFIIVTQLDAPVLTTLLRWLAPSLFLSGLGMWITLRSRTAILGLLMVGLTGMALIFSPGAFIPGQPLPSPFHYIQPFAWGIHAYMQPTMLVWNDYLLNRGLVAVIGILLMGLTVLELRNTEKILLGQRT